MHVPKETYKFATFQASPGKEKKGREELSSARCLLLKKPFQDLFLLLS